MQVAYVLGQLQDDKATAALAGALANTSFHPMVRHEAAIALGSIAGEPTPMPLFNPIVFCCQHCRVDSCAVYADAACVALLQQFSEDSDMLVRESCVVALDMLHDELKIKEGIV